MLISKIKISKQNTRRLIDIPKLASDIKENGLKHPIIVTENGSLKDGFRRIKAVQLLGWTEIDVKILQIE